ncbi:hypothetical protein CLU79DRAFT_750813 [Phycomyces nitens]|nr:hypothetical protein CLU79DRAFT_750813 [Phycomyces nitens]
MIINLLLTSLFSLYNSNPLSQYSLHTSLYLFYQSFSIKNNSNNKNNNSSTHSIHYYYSIMKSTMLMLFSIAVLLSGSSASRIKSRGVATLMDLEPRNSTEDGLERRANRGTWYTGADLRNAACYDRNGLSPFHATNYDMIGAMAMNDFEQCYKCMKIVNNRNPKLSVIVKIVDKCAACKVAKAIDLTPAAFKKISPKGSLDIGVLDISWTSVRCSSSRGYPTYGGSR